MLGLRSGRRASLAPNRRSSASRRLRRRGDAKQSQSPPKSVIKKAPSPPKLTPIAPPQLPLAASDDQRLEPQAPRHRRLALTSVGYRSLPVDGTPFDEARGVVPNVGGRVEGEARLYVAGWLKRGPSGVILTNVADAAETVAALLADRAKAAAAGGAAGGRAARGGDDEVSSQTPQPHHHSRTTTAAPAQPRKTPKTGPSSAPKRPPP